MNQHPSTAPQAIQPHQVPVPVPAEMRPDPGVEPDPAPLGIPRAYREGKFLVVENEPSLPVRVCIKSGRPASKHLEVALRDPKNPKTWFGKRPMIEIGLCRKEFDNYRVAIALTWATLGVGALLFIAGLASTGLMTSVVGLFAMGVSGVFRALSPVTSPDATWERATVVGVAPGYLAQFPAD